jgi:hypothetical protein
MKPWNDWYHVMGHTYGTWLPGDPKGFRTRNHREHVEGDYKNPPPKGKYDQLWKRSKDLMNRDPVYLTIDQRHRAVEEIVRSLKKWGIELRIASIDRIHLHALTRVIDHNPRHWIGLAKKESSANMKRDGLAPQGGLWAVGCKCLPITGADHFENTTGYIRDHKDRGAVIHESISKIQFEVDIPSLLLDE